MRSPASIRITLRSGKTGCHALNSAHGRVSRQIRSTRQSERFPPRSGWNLTATNNGALNPTEHSIREEILAGLLADKGGEAQISTAMRVLAEIIASDVAQLVSLHHSIDLSQ